MNCLKKTLSLIICLLLLVEPITLNAASTDSPVWSNETEDLAMISTTITKAGARDSYEMFSGSFDTEKGEDALVKFVSDKLKSFNADTNSDFYFEVSAVDVIDESGRTPQSDKSNLDSAKKRFLSLAKNTKENATETVKTKLPSWFKNPINKKRITYTLICVTVDGGANAAALVLFDNVSMSLATAVGATIAGISGSWAFFSPEIATWLEKDPVRIHSFFKMKNKLLKSSTKFAHGILKWGLISLVYTSVISGGSHLLGVVEYTSFKEWAMYVGETAGYMTIGQGIFDYSVNTDYARKIKNPLYTQPMRIKALNRAYLLGTIAASIATLGAMGSTVLQMDFGDILLYGLMGAGVTHLAYCEREAIAVFLSKLNSACKLPLKKNTHPKTKPLAYESWGSE